MQCDRPEEGRERRSSAGEGGATARLAARGGGRRVAYHHGKNRFENTLNSTKMMFALDN